MGQVKPIFVPRRVRRYCGMSGAQSFITTNLFKSENDKQEFLYYDISVVTKRTKIRRDEEIFAMKALQPSTSYSLAFGVSSVDSCSIPSRHRHIMSAKVEPTEKSVEVMRKFSEQYARKSGTYFCVDKSVTSVVIKGLAEHKDTLGAPLCPCRHYDDKAAEAQQGFWNCPCVPMRERKECHCMLFLTPENDFAGQDQAISLEEIKETTSNM